MGRPSSEVKRSVLLRTASDWIEIAKDKTGARNDSDIARMLGATKQAICNYNAGRNGIGAKEAIRLGWLIGEDPIKIIITSAIHATKARQREQWLMLLEDYQTKLVGPSSAEAEAVDREQEADETQPTE